MADWENTMVPNDEVFEIGTTIKGTHFSEQLSNKSFLKWVNDLLARNYAGSHEQLRRFHHYARAHGAYSK